MSGFGGKGVNTMVGPKLVFFLLQGDEEVEDRIFPVYLFTIR